MVLRVRVAYSKAHQNITQEGWRSYLNTICLRTCAKVVAHREYQLVYTRFDLTPGEHRLVGASIRVRLHALEELPTAAILKPPKLDPHPGSRDTSRRIEHVSGQSCPHNVLPRVMHSTSN